MSDVLLVSLYGTTVARVFRTRQRDRLGLQWTEEALERWGLDSAVVSALLPLSFDQPPTARVSAWFRGLLPEGNALVHFAQQAGTDPDNLYGLLAAYGRDVAGALIIGDPSVRADPRSRPVDAAEIRGRLQLADSRAAPLGVADHMHSVSLAGMRPKITLARASDGGWLDCLGGYPSTFILKPAGDPETGDPESLDMLRCEAFALAVARSIGLTTVAADIEVFDGWPALVISRYDRVVEGEEVRRVHQEDMAQALGLDTRDPDRKFQYGKPLPSLAAIASVLQDSGADLLPLLSLTTLNVVLGNIDAHAKNISALHLPDGGVRLAPAYDIAPYRHHRRSGVLAPMNVNGVGLIDAVGVDDLVVEAVRWGVREQSARHAVADVVHGVRAFLSGVADRELHAAPDRAVDVVAQRAEGLAKDL